MAKGVAEGVAEGGMPLEASRREVPQLLQRETSASTNTELVLLAGDPRLPTFTTLITTDQTAGRGRLDRAWIAPAGASLAVSVLVRAETLSGRSMRDDALSWLPLAAGVAVFDAVTAVLPGGADVSVKWPNDVLVGGRKVCGILSEVVLPNAATPRPSVVIGAGVNLTMSGDQLPVPTATSLLLEGADVTDRGRLIDRVLAAYLHSLVASVTALWASEGDADLSGLRAAVIERCGTIGREVRVELPGGAELLGRAVGIDIEGRLEVLDRHHAVTAVAAGDIVHLR